MGVAVTRKLSYADAVRLIGGSDSRVVAVLDRLTGGLLLGAAVSGAVFALSLFEAKAELARLSGDLLAGLGSRLRGLSRFERTERLAAAHKVIVLVGFFECLSGADLPDGVAKLLRGRSAQVAVAAGEPVTSERLAALAAVLRQSDIPGDVALPGLPGEDGELAVFYASLGEKVLFYLEGLAAWDRLDPRARDRFGQMLTGELPAVAVRRYEEHLRRLAGEFPEVAFWVNRLSLAGLSDQLHRMDTGLRGLSCVLDRIGSGVPADGRRLALARGYRRSLDRPIVEAGEVPAGFVIPSLDEAYVNPQFRLAWVPRSAQIDMEWWWSERPVRDDLQQFLVGYLTSVRATECPLIVLGQPGSGKSLLTRILAARLPAADFLVVRVALRDTPADADLQSQIEYAIRDATGEDLPWPALSRSRGDALAVVLLDGFDELLQATGVGQTDYLDQIARFQEREADHGRPVTVVVTSRIAVANRARIPASGAVAVRLEPFTDDQVRRWLDVWNASNSILLATRGVAPLPAEAALRQRDLARQPLLLLMLALYDAGGNALQQAGETLDEADLYERILRQFAEREISKNAPGLHGQALAGEVEDELLRLSVAAFAMFNRGRQWVSDDELSADLAALLGTKNVGPPAATSFHLPATPAQTAISRFFFIHQAQAVRDDARLTTSEFLHATFGEFLVARLIVRELAELGAVARTRSRRVADIAFLHALLSFAPLTTRGTVVQFTETLAKQVPEDHRTFLRIILLTAFQASLEQQKDSTYDHYGPAGITMPIRYAAYSANLLLLTVIIDGPVTGRSLFPHADFPAEQWRRHAMLWRSQFTTDAWQTLVASLSFDRTWEAGDRDVCIGTGPWTPPEIDPYWTFKLSPGKDRWLGWRRGDTASLVKESYFTCDTPEDIAWHALAPVIHELDNIATTPADGMHATTAFGTLSEELAVSVTHAMIKVWTTSSRPCSTEELEQAYENCLQVIQGSLTTTQKPFAITSLAC